MSFVGIFNFISPQVYKRVFPLEPKPQLNVLKLYGPCLSAPILSAISKGMQLQWYSQPSHLFYPIQFPLLSSSFFWPIISSLLSLLPSSHHPPLFFDCLSFFLSSISFLYLYSTVYMILWIQFRSTMSISYSETDRTPNLNFWDPKPKIKGIHIHMYLASYLSSLASMLEPFHVSFSLQFILLFRNNPHFPNYCLWHTGVYGYWHENLCAVTQSASCKCWSRLGTIKVSFHDPWILFLKKKKKNQQL